MIRKAEVMSHSHDASSRFANQGEETVVVDTAEALGLRDIDSGGREEAEVEAIGR
jgi:hypothetical protein